jgi:glyoxylase I family protein
MTGADTEILHNCRTCLSKFIRRQSPGVHHIAFAAPTRLAVDDLYQTLSAMHATVLDPPRDYPQYEPGYYAVFFLDPDGIKLEYVFTPDE